MFELIQDLKNFMGRISTTIGINLWFVPQISEHCPKKRPGFNERKLIMFNRPGVESAFNPNAGIVHA